MKHPLRLIFTMGFCVNGWCSDTAHTQPTGEQDWSAYHVLQRTILTATPTGVIGTGGANDPVKLVLAVKNVSTDVVIFEFPYLSYRLTVLQNGQPIAYRAEYSPVGITTGGGKLVALNPGAAQEVTINASVLFDFSGVGVYTLNLIWYSPIMDAKNKFLGDQKFKAEARYEKRANQTPEPTAPSGRGSS